MNDKELLELAAKAAGIECEWSNDDDDGMWLMGERSPDNSRYWNPLTDDGDALRLAVKLELNVCYDGLDAINSGGCGVVTKDERKFFEPTNGDPYAATRRAIVRAAASIGKDAP